MVLARLQGAALAADQPARSLCLPSAQGRLLALIASFSWQPAPGLLHRQGLFVGRLMSEDWARLLPARALDNYKENQRSPLLAGVAGGTESSASTE